MAGRNYYLVTALPPLDGLGSTPPLTPSKLLEHVSVASTPRALVEALFLGDDLLQRQSFLAGESETPEPVVLTAGQVRDEEPLPPALVPAEEQPAFRVSADVEWELYYRRAADVAARLGSRFLAGWIANEVALRNALAEARAQALGLEPGQYVVAPELADTEADFDALVHDWSAAANPLEGLRVLDRARWEWLTAHDGWFTFGDDELAAYAAKLLLLHRWHRLAEAGEKQPAGAEGT